MCARGSAGSPAAQAAGGNVDADAGADALNRRCRAERNARQPGRKETHRGARTAYGRARVGTRAHEFAQIRTRPHEFAQIRTDSHETARIRTNSHEFARVRRGFSRPVLWLTTLFHCSYPFFGRHVLLRGVSHERRSLGGAWAGPPGATRPPIRVGWRVLCGQTRPLAEGPAAQVPAGPGEKIFSEFVSTWGVALSNWARKSGRAAAQAPPAARVAARLNPQPQPRRSSVGRASHVFASLKHATQPASAAVPPATARDLRLTAGACGSRRLGPAVRPGIRRPGADRLAPTSRRRYGLTMKEFANDSGAQVPLHKALGEFRDSGLMPIPGYSHLRTRYPRSPA